MRTRWRWIGVGLALVVGTLVARGPLTEALPPFVEAVRGAGAWGVLAFAAAYVLATVLALPGAPLTIAAGAVWGLGGVAVVSPASVLGAGLAFGLARSVARPWVVRHLGDDPRLAGIDRALASHGPFAVVLLRLSPVIPFNLLNYGLGLTSVSAPAYLAGSAIGMLPGTLVYVWAGTLAGEATRADPARLALSAVGLAATAAVAVGGARAARRSISSPPE